MGLTDYTISDKKYWQAGRDYERERIIKIIEDFGSQDFTVELIELIKEEQQ